ncbi:glycosyltransferase family 4 protein [Legionella hackeliae]|uniref:Putative glycosyl transferase n=1 Tax=Legionella hackeliae TaxID=449 RepID=A0A0A8UNC2_LEGHA|nr:glycosyltransferase family 4 protein [Legionella hackeliae]KTD08810.1 glycosyltransferase, group 1 family [Legionella hackeliae]CEK10238.1 putative glycosyl transferase [Legionella hackeliae]STX46967.1 glycosyltransferase, group 1 family [Legionella hackeliae]
MKILLVSQYFWPESFLINDLVKCLVADGHVVEVLTGKPNYPDGQVFKGYSASSRMTEQFNEQITVHRVPIFPRKKGGAKNLILNYFSFIVSGLFYFPRFAKGKQFDAILVFAPSPITSSIPAIYLKKRLRTHLAIWVQDLWPESLSATGFIRNQKMLNHVGKVVRWIYKASDTLLVQSKAFYQPVEKYADKEKIIYYPNSYLEAPETSLETEQIPRDLLSMLEQNFCLVFAGNLGTAQALSVIVNAAQQLKHLENLKIVLVGSGSMMPWLKEQKNSQKLDNLILAGRFPSTCMPHIFSRAAGLLVTLKQEEIFTFTVPSKIQAYLAAGRPIIAALDGEGAHVIHDAGAGFATPAEDEKALAISMEQLYHMDPADRNKLGQSGRAYFMKHFEMKKQSQRLIEILEDRVKPNKGEVIQ